MAQIAMSAPRTHRACRWPAAFCESTPCNLQHTTCAARARLQALRLSHQPTDLPGRQSERAAIRAFLREHVLAGGGVGGSLYICGTPGSGKTLMVSEALRALQDEARGARRFALVELSGMALSSVPSVFGHVRAHDRARRRPFAVKCTWLGVTGSLHRTACIAGSPPCDGCSEAGAFIAFRARDQHVCILCLRTRQAARLQIFDALPASLQKKAVGYGAEQWLRSALQPGGQRLFTCRCCAHAAVPCLAQSCTSAKHATAPRRWISRALGVDGCGSGRAESDGARGHRRARPARGRRAAKQTGKRLASALRLQ